jgi:PIN domain nuclease of toxin-antitoxin system
LPAGDAIVNSFSHQVAHLEASEIDLSATHAVAAGQLAWSHRDPFDRLLAAQAMIEGMTLVTDDQRLHGYEPLTTFW